MLKKSRSFFILFQGLGVAGVLIIVFLLVNTSLLKDESFQNAWITLAIGLGSILSALFMNREKASPFMRIVFSLLAFTIVFFGIKYFQLIVLKRLVTSLPRDLALLVISGSLFSLNLIFTWIMQSRFKRLYHLLDSEKEYENTETYLSVLRENIGGLNINTFSTKLAGTLGNITIVLLILSFITLVLQPDFKTHASIALVLYALSALGVYLLTYQMQRLLEWKLQGLSIPEITTHNWNRLIALLLGSALVVSLALPWYFKVFDFSNLNQGLKDRLTGVNITINPDPGEVRFKPSTNSPTQDTRSAQQYVVSSLNAKVWKGVSRPKSEVLKDIQSLELKLASPSLIRQIFTIDLYGPVKLYSDDLNRDNALIILSTNVFLAELSPEGQILLDFVVEKQNDTTIIDTPVDEVQEASFRMSVLRTILWSILGLVGLYFVSAIVGGILMIRYRYTRRSPLAQFFINRYNSVRGLINAVFFFFRLIGRFFLVVLGLRKADNRPKEKMANPVAQQLYSLFKQKEDMTDEKKDEVMTIIKEFVKLIDVTSRLIVPYRFFYGPKEYLDKVVSFQPDLKKIMEKISGIFNESRYSLHILGEAKLKAFSGSVAFAMEQISKLDVGGIKSQAEREQK